MQFFIIMNKILLAAVLAASAVISGCTEKQDAHPSVKIVPTIKTRVSGLHFDNGDQIGLTILQGEQPYAENHPMTYEGSAFSGSGLLWYDDLNETSTLTAYHPYSSAGVPAEFTVAADQTGGCASSDLLGAVKRDVKPGSAPVGMVFYHLMSQLTIFLTNNSGATVTSVSVGGLVPTATVDLTVPTAAAKADAAVAEIRAFKEESGTSYRVILVPQQAALTVTVGTSDGKSHSKTVASAQLVSGKQYDMSVTLTKIDMSVSLSGDINDWGEGGSLDGDDGGDDTGGDTGELNYGGDTYPTATIGGQVWMAENLRYKPAGASEGRDMWPSEDGLSAGMLYNYATATGSAVTAGDAPVQGICPAGWHIPTAAELESMGKSAELPDGFLSYAGFHKGTDYGDKTKGYLLSCSLFDEGRVCCLFYSGDSAPAVKDMPIGYYFPLRCVKD